MIKHLILLSNFLIGCFPSKSVDKIEPISLISFQWFEDRLRDQFTVGGFVIAKNPDDSPADVGDSLLFTGISLGVLDCDRLDPLLSGLEAMQKANNGYLVRFHPLPQSFIDKQDVITRDGATGALFGLVMASKRCAALRERVENILYLWDEAVGDSFLLHPKGKNGIITPSFRAFWDVAMDRAPGRLDYGLYVAGLLLTSYSIRENKSACYPVHLQTLENIVIEIMDQPLDRVDKSKWCEFTKDMGLMLTDWYCERDLAKVKLFLSDPLTNSKNIYEHQRCIWESESNEVGKISPRVDFLILSRMVSEGT